MNLSYEINIEKKYFWQIGIRLSGMPYLITSFSLACVLALQYFLSIWLIKAGYFYNHVHTFGGFLVLMVIYMNLVNYLLNVSKIKLSYQQAMIVKYSVFLFLIASFWLNYILMLP